MKFKKIYIEITNVCNFSCSFCCKTSRPKKFMSPEEFSEILTKIKPFTDYIYLHVLGEPLLHPQLETFLTDAHSKGFFVNITTNGSLIREKRDILLRQPVRQFNISLHSAEENIPINKRMEYFDDIFDFANEKSNESYFSLRFWNIDAATIKKAKNVKIKDRIFLQHAARFSWPGERELGIRERTCYALKHHVAILVDGTVVPCCLDANAHMALGNIFEEDFENIIGSEKAKRIIAGFRKHVAVEAICMDCGFTPSQR